MCPAGYFTALPREGALTPLKNVCPTWGRNPGKSVSVSPLRKTFSKKNSPAAG